MKKSAPGVNQRAEGKAEKSTEESFNCLTSSKTARPQNYKFPNRDAIGGLHRRRNNSISLYRLTFETLGVGDE
jgi:hypothetical protein